MSMARDVLTMIAAGLQRGVIKSPDIEMALADGPKRVSLLDVVIHALHSLPALPTGADAERIPEPHRAPRTPPSSHPALQAANEWAEHMAELESLPFGTRAYYRALASCDEAWERMAAACRKPGP